MFLETDPSGGLRKEPADYHFVDPEGLGRYAYFVRPTRGDLIPPEKMDSGRLGSGRYRPLVLENRRLFVSGDFYVFAKHLEEKGIESTDRGVMVVAMNKLREILIEHPEVLDNARLTADKKNLYLVKSKLGNVRD